MRRNVFIVWLIFALMSFSLPAFADKVYVDDCKHWLEIGAATVALRTKGQESLENVLGYIGQYLSDSKIPDVRRQQILGRVKQVWDEGLMFGHELDHRLMDKCDVE